MARCASCNSTIVIGGVREGDRRYCNAACRQEYALTQLSSAVPDELVEREVSRVFDGACPACGGAGPVDLQVSHRIWSALVLTQWRAHALIGCARCGQRARWVSLGLSLVLGWWGAPWGVLMTPIIAARNIAGLARGGSLTRASDGLRRVVRIQLGQAAIAQQAMGAVLPPMPTDPRQLH